MSNSDIRKQLGGMPTGENKLAGKTFRVIHHPAPKAPQKSIFDVKLFTAVKSPYQELEDGVNRWQERRWL